MIILLPY